jgi:hypothetical protein
MFKEWVKLRVFRIATIILPYQFNTAAGKIRFVDIVPGGLGGNVERGSCLG